MTHPITFRRVIEINGLISICFMVPYVCALAILPTAKWTRRQAEWIGVLLMVPIIVVQQWLTGTSSFLALYCIHLFWRVSLKGARAGGFDFASFLGVTMFIGIIDVIVQNQPGIVGR
jgi:hypothetical protein